MTFNAANRRSMGGQSPISTNTTKEADRNTRPHTVD